MTRPARMWALFALLTVALGVGIVLSSPVQVDPLSPTDAGGAVVGTTTTTRRAITTSTASRPTSTLPETTTTQQLEITYLVWTSGGLTDGLVAALESEFLTVSIVAGDVAPLDVGGGRVVPLDGVAIDVDSHQPFDPGADTALLLTGTVVLGATSAEYRGLGPGDVLSFEGTPYDVVGIAPDVVVGAAEVVFSKDDPQSPIVAERYALVRTELDRGSFEEVVKQMNDGPTPVTIRAEGETPWLRHGDSVLPQIFIKRALGEFSYPEGATSQLSQDRDWVSENIVTAEVPILGRVTCHRVILEMLSGALGQLVDEGLAHLVDRREFAGCWNPRFIRTVAGTPAGISRHSWGAAVDINAASNGLGAESTQGERLVEIMAEWGFRWGGEWAVPDPMHFEYGIDPTR